MAQILQNLYFSDLNHWCWTSKSFFPTRVIPFYKEKMEASTQLGFARDNKGYFIVLLGRLWIREFAWYYTYLASHEFAHTSWGMDYLK